MADVSVEFGAKDTGLEQTLKTIQEQLVSLDSEVKSGTLSFEEIKSKMREVAQAEKLHASLGGTREQLEGLITTIKDVNPEMDKLAQNSKELTSESAKTSTAFKTVAGEIFELQAALDNGITSADEFDKTLNRLNKLKGIQEKMDAFGKSTLDAGDEAKAADPKVDSLGKEMEETGNQAKDVGDKSEGGFLKMATAVAAGQAAVNIATAAMKAAFNLVRGSIDEFGAALDLGGRLSDLSERTGETAGNLLLLERAFDNSGVGADKVGQSINKLQKFIEDAGTGAAPQIEVMGRLGLTLEELAGKTPTEQMQVFAQKISDIEDPGKRAALAMEVFGRAGGELLPLLSNFSGEIGTAQDQLGGMVDVMNRNASTFDAVSDKVDVIAGKFMEFAAGVLDKVAPALDAVTEALSRVDAAAIGQKLADAFTGGVEAMRGFQSVVDSFNTGNIEDALALLWQSIKVQAMMTGDEIYKRLQAGFSAAWEFVKEIFAPDGMIVRYIIGAFQIVGAKITETLGSAVLAFVDALPPMLLKLNPVLGAVADSIRGTVNKASEDAQMIWGAMYHDVGYVGAQITGAASRIKDNFNTALGEANSLFTDTNAEAEKLAQMQADIAAKAGEAAAAIGNKKISEEEAAEEARKYFEQYQSGIAAIAEQNAAKIKSIENEIALNEAIASGNEEEIKRLQEKQRQAELSQKIKDIEASLPAIIEDIIKKTGTSEEEARRLAEQLVASRIAAAGTAEDAKKIKKPLEDANKEANSVFKAMADIEHAKMEAAPKRLQERTIAARKDLKEMADFIGEDLSQMSLDSILKKLGLDPDDFKTTNDKLKALEGAIQKIGGADPADITPDVDLVGVNDRLEKVKEYLKNAGKEKPDVTPKMDQEAVKKSVDKAKETIEKGLTKSSFNITLNAEESIGKIREQLKEKIDLAIESSKGTEHLSSIDKLVGKIEELVSKIEGKLPMQALAY